MADTLTSASISDSQLLLDVVDTPMTPVERVVRALVISGFLALLGFEAYMIWYALIVL